MVNEGKKTGIFWGVAGVVALIAIIASWKSEAPEDGPGDGIGADLFIWKDPLLASSMKIVTFDEDQGTLANFEVAKDKESGAWTIPSRKGYPADAVDQMKAAANSLIGLKALDNPTSNAEDHSKMGVLEPRQDKLEIGDEGVGRMVTIKDGDQKELASIIIGNPVKDQPGQIYVRIPGQDPVYTVKLDDKPLTTKFGDWIEDDLLKLSSIEIEGMQVKDYTCQLGMDPRSGQIVVNWQRKYDASLSKDGTQWSLDSLQEYDSTNPLTAKAVEVDADKKINTAKLNEIQSALDDLKIADVERKPDGISANLRADKDLLDDEKARSSLSQRGFYPIPTTPNAPPEILSANGELTVGLKDGVEYVLRFGNIEGVGDKEEEEGAEDAEGEKKSTGGVNRYLLVTTRVDDSHFPPPDLKDIPTTVEEMEAAEKKAQEPVMTLPTEDETPEVNVPTEPEPAVEMKKEEPTAEPKEEAAEAETETKTDEAETADDKPEAEMKEKAEAATEEVKAEEAPVEEVKKADENPADENPVSEKPAEEAPKAEQPKEEAASSDVKSDEPAVESGETVGEGSGEATGEGQGKSQQESDDEKTQDQESDKKADEASSDDKPEAAKPAEEMKSEPAAEEKPADEPAAEPVVEETEEEKQERLEAVQEKITKENQRKIDLRNDQIAEAKKKVRELNARFADWYYVIPEDTYQKLTMTRDDLFEKEEAAGAPGPNPGAGGPSFNPGGFVPNLGN